MGLPPRQLPHSTTNRAERRKTQNREAQRNHRRLIKEKVEAYDQLMEMFESVRGGQHENSREFDLSTVLDDGIAQGGEPQLETSGSLMTPVSSSREERCPNTPRQYNVLTTESADNYALDLTPQTAPHDDIENDQLVSALEKYSFGLNEVFSPLHEAVLKGDIEIISLLIERGAQLDIQDNTGSTPLHLASGLGNEKIASLLLKDQDKSQLQIVNAQGLTPLRVAIRNGHAGVVRILLDEGVDVNGRL